MELISYYIEHFQTYPVEYLSSLDLLREEYWEIDERWCEFHQAQEPMIAYVCDRQTGKTTNMLKRIVMSDESYIMVITRTPNMLCHKLILMCTIPVEREFISGGYKIKLNQKTIYVIDPAADNRGFPYMDAVYYDEPELFDMRFRIIREWIRAKCDREIAVGSLYRRWEDTEFKRFFREANHARSISSDYDEINDEMFRRSIFVNERN
jgi:hypothetical protein